MSTPKSQGPHHGHDHDRGLEFDLHTLLTRRRALSLAFGGAAAAALAACAPGGGTASSAGTSAGTAPAAPASETAATRAIAECGVPIPAETAGPYPGHGGNGPNVLEESGIVRRDLTGSFGGGTGSAEGVPLTLTLTILDGSNGCAPYRGAAVYAWHCDRDGRYSLYDAGLEDENFLRGVQEADGNGHVTFTTVFPGAYNGRWPHVHFEVFDSLNNINSTGRVLKVSQVALPEAACTAAYASTGYETSRRNFPKTPLARDGVFRDDGGVHQLAATTGSVEEGFVAALNVTL